MDLKEFDDKIDRAIAFNDGCSRIQALDIIIDETNSSSLPVGIKERIVGRCASLQMEAVVGIDVTFENDMN